MCAAIANGVLNKASRTNADLIFREILKADGMPRRTEPTQNQQLLLHQLDPKLPQRPPLRLSAR